MAKPMPSTLETAILALLMPMTLPSALTRAPPELPGLMAASVWIRLVQGRNDAHGHAPAEFQAEGIADGDGRFPDLDVRGIPEFRHGQVVRVDLDDGQVRRRIRAEDLAGNTRAVGQAHDDFRRAFDDVVVRHDQAGLVINDAGACTPFGQLHPVEEIAHIGLVRNADHRRADRPRRLHDRRVARAGHVLFLFLGRPGLLLLFRHLGLRRLGRLLVLGRTAAGHGQGQQEHERHQQAGRLFRQGPARFSIKTRMVHRLSSIHRSPSPHPAK